MHTDKHADKQTGRQTNRQTDKLADRHIDIRRRTNVQADSEKQTHMQNKYRHTVIQADRQTCIQIIQTDQTDRQA